MAFRHSQFWFRQQSAKSRPAKRTGICPSRRNWRPQVENLETRDLPSFAGFAPPINFTVGRGATSGAVGDFNGDGHLDLAVVNSSDDTVSVLLGNGDGSFQSHRDYATGAGPFAVAVGDFDGDGKPDLAVTNNRSNTVSILLDNGDGTFRPRIDYSTGTSPKGIAVGDFNGDGKPDLAVVDAGSGTVSVLLGNGDGTFGPKTDYPVGFSPVAVAVGDFNGDGKPDLAVATSSNTVSILLGNGDGTFQSGSAYATGSGPDGVAVGDFDGNGHPDLVVTNRSSNTVSVFPGNGDGTFQPRIDYATGAGPNAAAIGDFNGNGRLDLAVTNWSAGTVSVLLGNGDGTFQSKVDFSAGPFPLAQVVGDFIGNGKSDLAIIADLNAPGSVLVNQTGVPHLLALSAPLATGAGSSFSLTMTVQDPGGNLVTNYRGTVHFTSSDLQASLPADYTFSAADNGVHTFAVTLKTAGTMMVNAADTAASVLRGSTGVAVSPAGAATLTVSGFGSSVMAGTSQSFTVTAFDPYGNVSSGYLGTIHFTSNDRQASLPADYTFTAADAGVHTVAVTFRTAGSIAITAADTANSSIQGNAPTTVTPAAAVSLVVSGFGPPVTAGVMQTVTVTTLDSYGNVAAGYGGTVHFTSSDPQAALPADYTFLNSDRGAHTFSFTWKTAGTQTITVQDNAASTLHATSAPVSIVPAAAQMFRLSAPASGLVGTAFSVTVRALDPYGNLVPGYRGTVHWTSSQAAPLLPPDYGFTAADNGVHTFAAVILQQAGNGVVAVTDTANSAVAGSTTLTLANPLEEVFVIGLDHQVYGQKLDAAGNPKGGYFRIASGVVKALSTGHDVAGRPIVFVIGLDSQVWALPFDAGGNPIAGYFLTARGAVQALSVGRDAAGRPETFVVGLDGQVYAHHFDANNNPTGTYFLTSAGVVKSLSVGRDAAGHPETFVIGSDNQVYAEKFDANGNPVSSYFLTQPGQVKSLVVGHDAHFNPELFVIGLDNQVYAEKFDINGNPASSYFLTQPGQVKMLTVGLDTGYNPLLYVIGLDDQVYGQKMDANGNPAGGFFFVQAGQVKGIQAGVDAENYPELFVTGLDDQVYGQKCNAAGDAVGGYFLMQPGRQTGLAIAN